MIAKLLAASGFRRRSYDDQEGDNDVTIIMQPSDLHDIEKRRAARLVATATSSHFKTSPHLPDVNNLDLARSLLDQDYNLTVRLFIRSSALNWNFNSFTFDALCCGRSLTELLLHLFDYYDLYTIFNLNIVNVLKCFRLLEFGYHSTNPYHNSIHAADVTQAMHCFIQENKIRKHMTHLETLCSILAAVCHDLDHPGVNQSFLVATNNPLASLYNNNSVLENHHWRFALCIFRESQLFDHFSEDVYDEMKKQLKYLILATDIARQNEYLKRFRDLTASQEFSMENTEDRALVLQMALKCADLCNPCRPWLISRVWSNLICDEFYKMGTVERRLGIPLTPICQREKTSIAGIQADFFRFIVLPLLELWHKFLESPLSTLLMTNFSQNYQRWQRASRIVQQLKRRKSIASLEPVEFENNEDAPVGDYSSANVFDDPSATLGLCSRYSFEAIKRASSDYVKSGSGGIEYLRNFQLDRIIEKSPLISRLNDPEVREKLNKSGRSPSIGRIRSQRMCNESKKTGTSLASSQMLASSSVVSSSRPDTSVDSQQNFKPNNSSEKNSSELKLAEQYIGVLRTAQSINPSKTQANCASYRKALSPIEDGDAPSPEQSIHKHHQEHHHRCQHHEPPSEFSPAATTTTATSMETAITEQRNQTSFLIDQLDPAGSAFPSSLTYGDSGSSESSSVSQASSACSSPVIQRSVSSRTSINDQLASKSVLHTRHISKHHQHPPIPHHHPFLAQYYGPSSGPRSRPSNLTSGIHSPTTTTTISNTKSHYNSKRRESDPGCCTDKYELAAAIVLIQYQKGSLYNQRRSSLPVCGPRRRSSK